MIPETSFEEREVLEAVKYLPSVSIILPFEPKMSVKKELEYQLQRVVEKVEKELMSNYAGEKVKPVLNKLKALIKKLDFTTYKQSIAIYVSPLMEKVFYLDIPVEEKVIIDESFEIRDLVYSKKDIHKYLILALSNKSSRIFLGNTIHFVRIATNTPENSAAYETDLPERVANFSDPSGRKEILMDKFLHHVDAGLGIILKAYALPFFVMGTERTIGHFKKITHNANHVIDYIYGNYEEASETDIREKIVPYVADWKKVRQRDLLLRVDAAKGAKKLVTGIQDVWKATVLKMGRLLVVEKNYMCSARHSGSEEIIYPEDGIATTPFNIKDAVDDIIEKVLENGGDVEFVDEGLLKDYGKIALLKYY